MAVTMQDVARYAAVSTATVSRVLNNPEVVNEETRRQVLDAIKALNYRMNRTARSLRTSRTNRLAIVISDTGDPLVAQILEAFEDAAVRQHYAVQLCISH
ncbi:MAG TPA: LacI family DNA-binding transcriptional regulator, partial [Aggregatilineales bacterium]|nr:LacI family DNA-binding transcriptional regulator [Aggregatilineales bacterium]